MLGRGNNTDGTMTINRTSYLDSGDGLVMLSGGVEVVQSGGHPHVLLGAQGIKVFWDGMNRVEVTVSSSWQGRLCGLCGDYNGDSTDNFVRPDGQQVSDANEFAASWAEAVEDPSSCGTLPQADPCFRAIRPIAIAMCNTLQSSAFVPCHATVDPQPFIDNCIDDFCVFCDEDNRDEYFCRSLSAYASVCSAAGIQLQQWRDVFCPCELRHQIFYAYLDGNKY